MSNENQIATVAQETTSTAIVKADNGKPALFNPAAFDQIWRASKLFASSDLVPTAYKGKPENCFIAIEMADRMGISPFAMLQSLVIIQGKPSMEAKLIIALVNDSGIFENPLEYEIVGDDPHAQNYKVRAFATMKKTGKLCQGPWITYQMVKGEGWLDKGGSKWKTMPSIMFMYRAASFFAKVYCPNITMGMQTREEMEDIKTVDITPERQPAPALVEPTTETAPAIVQAEPAGNEPPALVSPIVDAEPVEVVDEATGEVTEQAQPLEESRPEPEKRRRGKAAAAEAGQEETPPHPAEDPEPHVMPTTNDEPMGDLF